MEDDNVGVIVNTAGVDFRNPTSRDLYAKSVKNGEYCVCILLCSLSLVSVVVMLWLMPFLYHVWVIHTTLCIVFTDIFGFSLMSMDVTPKKIMDMLQNLFSRFDELCDVHGVLKLE